tara:strand:- start:980 stop:1447 length:468 start_codon:yes stop_codon:yes gene_type:complete
MGTRCQVRVKSEGLSWNEERWLYHHWDGYPENMVPIINKAQTVYHNNFVYNQYDPETQMAMKSTNAYQNGRAGKVSAFLCAVDPTGFEPEDVGDLHGDIEYLYKLFLVNKNGGAMGEKPVWEMEIYEGYGDDMKIKIPRTEISQLVSWKIDYSNV